jgi:Asp-tRNA(Asn)/Glu-tRNA(Gln) amidotransferase A subunit family amidase
MGSDIGGSIRIPASFCGIYGIKPCSKRILTKGSIITNQVSHGFKNLCTSNGPLGKYKLTISL